MDRIPWWLTSLIIAAVSASIVWIAILLYPNMLALTIVAVFVAAFLYALSRNPNYFYRRSAIFLLGGWLSCTWASGFNFAAKFTDNALGIFLDNVGWAFHLAAATTIIALCYLDYRQNGKTSNRDQSNSTLAGDENQEATPTEFERQLSLIPESARANIISQKLDAENGNSGVPTDNITRDAKRDLKAQDIRAKSELNQIKAKNEVWKWICGTSVLLTFIVVVGSIASNYSVDADTLRHRIGELGGANDDLYKQLVELDVYNRILKDDYADLPEDVRDRYVEKLQKSVSKFEKDFGHVQLTDEFKFILAVAKSTLAIANGNVANVGKVLTESDMDFALEAAELAQDQIERAINAFWNSGIHHYTFQDYSEALSDFENVLKLQPTNGLAKGNVAICLWRLRSYDKAKILCESLISELVRIQAEGEIDVKPRLAWIYSVLGDVLLGQTEIDKAIASHGKAIEILLSSKNGSRTSQVDLAVAYNNRGNAYLQSRRLQDALSDFSNAVSIYDKLFAERDDNDVLAKLATSYMNRGACYLELSPNNSKFLESALADLNYAIKHFIELEEKDFPVGIDIANALMNRGNLNRELRETERAVSDYQASVAKLKQLIAEGHSDLEDLLARSHMNLGTAFDDLDLPTEALAEYEVAIDKFKKLLSSGREDLRFELTMSYFNRGRSFQAINKDGEAKRDFELTIQHSKLLLAEFKHIVPYHVAFLNELALLLATTENADTRDPKKSLEYARAACELSPQAQWECRSTLSLALAALGNYSEAADVLTQAIKHAPNEMKPELLERLASYEKNCLASQLSEVDSGAESDSLQSKNEPDNSSTLLD